MNSFSGLEKHVLGRLAEIIDAPLEAYKLQREGKPLGDLRCFQTALVIATSKFETPVWIVCKCCEIPFCAVTFHWEKQRFELTFPVGEIVQVPEEMPDKELVLSR